VELTVNICGYIFSLPFLWKAEEKEGFLLLIKNPVIPRVSAFFHKSFPYNNPH
jgi:hypothetical protein